MPGTEQHLTSDQIHNRNCFNHLKQVKLPPSILALLPEELRAGIAVVQDTQKYEDNKFYPYGDLYKNFFDYIEENINKIYSENSQLVNDLDKFINSLYENDNRILEETFEDVKDVVLRQTPSSPSIEHSITHHVRDGEERINRNSNSPAQEGSAWGRFSAMMASTYQPQHGTSLSTVRHYEYHHEGQAQEFRFGTQGQRHQGEPRVSPLFEHFLESQARRTPLAQGQQITHIYFNNLGRDRTGTEGSKEKALTYQLEGLESRHQNLAVITLPADKGLMDQHEYEKTDPKHNWEEVKHEFLQIAVEDESAKRKIKDFYISPIVREKLFQDTQGKYSKEVEKEKLGQLIDQSIKALGLDKKDKLSDAERQAVWFHFIKYELTNYIIETLKPQSFNFTCKDAIDRGGVSSAYYNLLKSFEPASKSPMSRDEFERALHAAPTMVKGRGMNHHIKLIWNTVDIYVNKNYEDLKKDPNKAWIIEWRDFNCPHERVKDLLSKRNRDFQKELLAKIEELRAFHPRTDEIEGHMNRIVKGLDVLAQIKKQSEIGVSGNRLLLESAVRTAAMALNPKAEEKDLTRYEELSKNLSANPVFKAIGGSMKVLLGAILYKTVFGKKLFDSGLETFKTGTEGYASRKNLQQAMRAQLTALRATAKPAPEPEPDKAYLRGPK